MKFFLCSLILFLGQFNTYSQQVHFLTPSGSHQQVLAIGNVAELPAEVVSIEQEGAITLVKFRDGKEENFDLSKEAYLQKFMKLFKTDKADRTYQTAFGSESKLRVLSPLSSDQDIRAIRSINGETTFEIIPKEVAGDKQQLLKWLKRYNSQTVQ